MITIEKTYALKDAANDITLMRLQEVIALGLKQYGWVGKAIIDSEKITFKKFGMTLGYAHHSTNGFVVNEYGVIKHSGLLIPAVHDRQILAEIYRLFGKRMPL